MPIQLCLAVKHFDVFFPSSMCTDYHQVASRVYFIVSVGWNFLPQDKNSPEGMEGPARRFVKFGGGASAAQLTWLEKTLADAGHSGQRVILCCHLPLHPDTCPGACLLWNYEEVLQICGAAGNVVATFCGHAHEARPHFSTDRFDWMMSDRELLALL
jgi:3',5'-cyclic AMP phosphodiesterase CpdA